MKRIGALVLAAVMVAAAFAARGSFGGDDEDEAAGGGDPQPVGIVCASDLADVCAAAGVQIAGEPQAGDTADALIAARDTADLGGAAWLTTSAWASLVEDERRRIGAEPLFAVAGGTLASSPVLLAVWTNRAEQLADRCGLPSGTMPGWRCMIQEAGTALAAGDRVQVAGPEIDSAAGLVVAASQSVGFFGGTDFSLADFETQGFRSGAAELSRRTTDDALRRMRAEGPGQLTATGALRVDAGNLSSNLGTIVASQAEPEVRADVVLVVPPGTDVPEDERAALTDALLAAGWDPPADGPAGLPSGGVLAAIRTLWTQNR